MARSNEYWHRTLEGKAKLFTVLVTVTILIGGLVEIVPMYTAEASPEIKEQLEPLTPLELAGRDIYVREGCYNCHSQMVRPLYAETLRYGDWTRSYEYTWDRPFQLGSRRIGPDLAREGCGPNPRSHAWHYDHFNDPRSMQPGSIMPSYHWLLSNSIDVDDVTASVTAMQSLGVPYSDDEISNIESLMQTQGQAIVDELAETGAETEWDREIIAMIAYVQQLGCRYNEIEGGADDVEETADTEEASDTEAPEEEAAE